MKKTFAVLITTIVILSMVGTVFAASAPPGTGWYTGITFQNVDQSTDTTPATVEVTAYGTGSTTATASLTLNQNESKSILPTDFAGMDAGFQGGAIASSSKELRSIVNVTNRYLSAQGLGDSAATHPAAAQYQGMSNPNVKLLFPLAKNDNFGKTTTFYVQNAGGAAATATADFVFAGVHYTYTTPSLNQGQTAVFSAKDAKSTAGATPPTGNSAASVGALTVTSTVNLAGVFLEHKTTEQHATLLQSTRAFTPSDADSVLFVPTNKDNYFNRFTGVQVQNVGPGAIDLKITYTNTADTGSGCNAASQTASDTTTGLAEGASWTFPSAAIPGDKCLAAAKVEVTNGSGKIVGVVNESFTAAYVNTGKFQESTTYFAFPANSFTGTTKVSIPVYKEDSFNKGTGVTIQNVNTGDASVTLTLTGPKGTFTSAPITITGGASKSYSDLRNQAAAFWKANTTPMTPAALGCTATGCGAGGAMAMIISSNVPVVAVANESTYPFTAPRIQQDKNNFEGFNLP